MPYDLDDIRERVREYIAVRHPGLHLDEPCSLTVVPAGEDEDSDWMFYIQYENRTMSAKHLAREFDRYTCDMPAGTMEARQGCGNDYITVRSGLPLLVGDGDDSLAVEARDGIVRIWLRAI
jgi:hypothetical protein